MWELTQWIDSAEAQIIEAMLVQVAELSERLENLNHRLHLQHPVTLLLHHQEELDRMSQRLIQCMANQIAMEANNLEHFNARLMSQHPGREIGQSHLHLNQLMQRISNHIEYQTETAQLRLHNAVQRLNSVNPLNTLARGYTITRDKSTNRAITKATAVESGQHLVVEFQDGKVAMVAD